MATGSIRSLANVGLSRFQNLRRLELQDLEDNEASFMLQLEAATFKEISIQNCYKDDPKYFLE